jgi:S-adenosylmethionine/arginine decarboxylase-like enzyme
MNTHYVTFILRLRLDSSGSLGIADSMISGSVQQVGLQKIRYFDSPERLHETLQELLPIATIPSENTDRPFPEETRSGTMENRTNCWGVSACIDLYGCELALMQDESAIKQFVRELCDLIKMRRFGETQVVRFGDDPRVTGFSMTQLIETSLISAHFADNSCAVYLDVFSCSPYDPDEAAAFAAQSFKAQRYTVQVVERK